MYKESESPFPALSPTSETVNKSRGKKHGGVKSSQCPQEFARPFLFLAVFFGVTRDGLSEKGTTRIHDSCGTLRELQPDPTLACRSADTSKAAYCKVTSTTPDAIQLKPAC